MKKTKLSIALFLLLLPFNRLSFANEVVSSSDSTNKPVDTIESIQPIKIPEPIPTPSIVDNNTVITDTKPKDITTITTDESVTPSIVPSSTPISTPSPSILKQPEITTPVISDSDKKNQIKKISLIINTVKDNLFSITFNGGRELQAFISSDEDYKSIKTVDIPYNIFRYQDSFILLKKTKVDDKDINIDISKLKIDFVKDTQIVDHEVNDYIVLPNDDSEEFLKLGLQRYKLSYPFSKAKVSDKKYYSFEIDENFQGYIITSKDIKNNQLKEIIKNNDYWVQKVVLPFVSSINGKYYPFVMVGNDPYDAIKIQQMVKSISSKTEPNKTLKISYGDIFSTTNKERKLLELENFKDNAYSLVLPSSKELDFKRNELTKDEINELTKASTFIGSNIKSKTSDNIFKPYVIKKVNGLNIAVLGIVDDFLPKANNTVNNLSNIYFDNIENITDQYIKELINRNDVDLILILTNFMSSKDKALELKNIIYEKANKYPRKQFLFVSLDEKLDYSNQSQKIDQKLKFESPEICINIPLKKDVNLIELNIKDKFISEVSLENEKLTKTTSSINPRFIKMFRNSFSVGKLGNIFVPPDINESILPDFRDVIKYAEKNNIDIPTNSEGYSPNFKALMVAGVFLEKNISEIAITKKGYDGGSSIGRVGVNFFKEWFLEENDKVITLALKGSDIKELINKDKQVKIFDSFGLLNFNGVSISKNIIRGRSIVDTQLYRIVTSQDIYNNLLFQDIFSRSVNVHLKDKSVYDTTFEFFSDLLKKYEVEKNDFGDKYIQNFFELVKDKSDDIPWEWRVSLKNVELKYNRDDIKGNDGYASVKDSRVNAPNNYDLGFAGKLSSLIDSDLLKFENTLSSNYNQSFISTKDSNNSIQTIQRKGRDDITIATDLQIKFITIGLQDHKISFNPFLNSSYSTEFQPTINPETKKENPRRSEFNNTAGIAFYPLFVNELRIGFTGNTDLSASKTINWSTINPGIIGSLDALYQLGNYSLSLQGNYRYLFPSPNETNQQLSTYGEINSKLAIPLFNGLSINLNGNAFIFRGSKELRDRELGYGFNTSVGLGWSFSSKPVYGSFF
jgi:hypothetical protein